MTARERHWYRGAIVRGGRKALSAVPHRAIEAPWWPRALVLVATSTLALAGCGGGSRQDAGEKAGTFAMRVVNPSFPSAQSIARQTKLVLPIRNTGTHTVPNVAVTIDSFDYTSSYPELADAKRPVWAIERGPGAIASPPVESEQISPPGGGQTAYVNTWALGKLAPGATRTFVWRVVPVKSGTYTVHYTVAAGLAGKARARLSSGGLVQGQFAVKIASAPELKHVNPATGRVEAGEFPSSP